MNFPIPTIQYKILYLLYKQYKFFFCNRDFDEIYNEGEKSIYAIVTRIKEIYA